MTKATVHFADADGDKWFLCHVGDICAAVVQGHAGEDGTHGTMWCDGVAVQHLEV